MSQFQVQFSDASETAVVSVFAGAQDPAVYSNLGTVDSGDPRLSSFLQSLSTIARPVTT